MAQRIRYGVIGCGMMGQEHLHNIALLEGAEVGAVFEPDADMRLLASEIAPTAVMAESFDDLLAMADLDCLLVVSPNHLHADQLLEIASKNPLPLLVEKPLLTDPEDAGRVAAMAAEYAAPIWVAMEYRYMPPIAAFLNRADAVTGGIRMLSMREHRFPFLDKVGAWNRFNRYTGGTFVEKCCHFFDLMRLITRDEPVRVAASAAQAVNHLDESYGGQTPDIADHGYVMVEFAGGCRAMLDLCMFAEGARFQEELSAVGPTGKIECFVPGPRRFWSEDLGPAPVPRLDISPRHPKGPVSEEVPVDPALLAAGDHNGATFYQHQRFLDVVRGGALPEVTLSDGLKAVQIGMAAQKAAETGESVRLRADASGLGYLID